MDLLGEPPTCSMLTNKIAIFLVSDPKVVAGDIIYMNPNTTLRVGCSPYNTMMIFPNESQYILLDPDPNPPAVLLTGPNGKVSLCDSPLISIKK